MKRVPPFRLHYNGFVCSELIELFHMCTHRHTWSFFIMIAGLLLADKESPCQFVPFIYSSETKWITRVMYVYALDWNFIRSGGSILPELSRFNTLFYHPNTPIDKIFQNFIFISKLWPGRIVTTASRFWCSVRHPIHMCSCLFLCAHLKQWDPGGCLGRRKNSYTSWLQGTTICSRLT